MDMKVIEDVNPENNQEEMEAKIEDGSVSEKNCRYCLSSGEGEFIAP